MKKLCVTLMLVMLAVTTLFAAGAKEDASKKDVTLSVLWFNDGNESEVFLKTMDDYLKANPNITLDLQIVAYNEYDQKLKLMISGGNPPDLARITTNTLSVVVDSLEPIDNHVQDIEAVKKQYLPSMVAFASNKDGKFVAYPTEATANGMLVNKTAFNNAGIDVDEVSKTWTWGEWETIIKKVLAANPKMKYGLAVDFTPHRFSTIMYQWGGHFLNADQSSINFNNPGTIETLKWFKHVHDAALLPKSVWLGSENPAELFQAGLVAGHIGGSWNINTYNKNVKDFEWKAVRMPKGLINSSVPGGKFVASFKGSKNQAEAFKFMAAFADKTHNEIYSRDTFNIPSRNDAVVTYPSNSEDFKVFLEELKVTPAFTADEWKNTNLSKVTTYIREQIVEVLLGNITAEQAAANVDTKGAPYFK
ncbi:sugar ABC transporter substrate-binding protein [Sphaerochaeta sp. PS]|uniref:ABC transporter substrate-binding protein n=1 Tax=Sphaerochaeta sp. PS TaxID=3076336 RepID=UPI0028A3C0F4|nr:sugar ABC transporter substrate-binding protein [Sphaerochaeta sp. PS]MDT4763341.1 sugar ABC transporter substrate-binding protein [Sphaerochaeta sp. PS]